MKLDNPWGSLAVITGPMYSGKTEALLELIMDDVRAEKSILVFKSALDDRYEGADKICSHKGRSFAAIPVRNAYDILLTVMDREYSPPDRVFIDEVQFLEDDIVGKIDQILSLGTNVVTAGTDIDFRGRPFGPMPKLLCGAEEIVKLTTVCQRCLGWNGLATRNLRLVDGKPTREGPTILVGGQDSYQAVCRSCYDEVFALLKH